MIRFRSVLPLVLACVLLGAGVTGCASAPKTLNAEAAYAFQTTKVIKALDLVRDIAIDANANKPTPLFSEASTRRVVSYHQAALKTMDAYPAEWQEVVETGLNETVKTLSPSEQQLLAPYVNMLKSLLEVSR